MPLGQTILRREGAPFMEPGSDYPTVETLALVIAQSQIVVAQPHSPMPSLPGGFDHKS